jgi:hypothetical protein
MSRHDVVTPDARARALDAVNRPADEDVVADDASRGVDRETALRKMEPYPQAPGEIGIAIDQHRCLPTDGTQDSTRQCFETVIVKILFPDLDRINAAEDRESTEVRQRHEGRCSVGDEHQRRYWGITHF